MSEARVTVWAISEMYPFGISPWSACSEPAKPAGVFIPSWIQTWRKRPTIVERIFTGAMWRGKR